MVAQIDRSYLRASPGSALVRLLSYAVMEGRPATTAWRWFNPVSAGAQSLLERLPDTGRSPRPIYIVGTGRSGTTLLGKILSLHSGLAWLNEPKLAWSRINPRDDIVGSYSQGPGTLWLDGSDLTEASRARARRLFAGFLRLAHRGRLLDKYPEMIFRVPYLRAAFPDARFVLLARRCADFINSVATWNRGHARSRQGSVENWWGVDDRKWQTIVEQACRGDHDPMMSPESLGRLADDASRATVEWLLAMREGVRQRKALGQEILDVLRFEELQSRPGEVIGALLDALSLTREPRVMQYAERVVTARPSTPASVIPEPFREFVDATESRLGY